MPWSIEFDVLARSSSHIDAIVRLKQGPQAKSSIGATSDPLDPRLREIALSRAEQMLPAELQRTPQASRARLTDLWTGNTIGAGKDGQLWRSIADALLEPLLRPLGNATSKLTDATPDADAAMHADLYWRCAIAVSLMPTAALEGIARHHADLTAHLLPEASPANERQRALVRAVLPRFTMVCTTADEARAAEKRRAEIEAIKRERQHDEERERKQRNDVPAADIGDATAEEGVLL